ncbi:MAG: polymer-forming cytoskeletal protein [Deltaproteobacteria bacterium]|jgi:cytoskeletal protein CcmA (bactofilin family)|nr:polymer-forming cytoskeletal protein [Deltaproteobacteria bacterium]MDR1296968.1 polymer-forming cytoskeletal protein [Deltaproteobacteria bacterium]
MFGGKSKNGKLGKHVWNAFFASSVEIEGSLRFSGLLNIDGNLTGAIVAKGMLVTGVNATITGDIFVENLIISGTVRGNVYATGEVHLNDTAKVYGNINYSSLSIIPGAFHEGNSHFFSEDERKELTARIHAELHLPGEPDGDDKKKNKKSVPSLPLNVPETKEALPDAASISAVKS